MPDCTPVHYLAAAILALVLLLGWCFLATCTLRRQARQLRARMDYHLEARTLRTMMAVDALRQSVQGLVLKVHGVARRLPADGPLRAVLEEAMTQAEAMVWGQRDLVCDPAADQGGELGRMLAAYAEELASPAGPVYDVKVQGRLRSL